MKMGNELGDSAPPVAAGLAKHELRFSSIDNAISAECRLISLSCAGRVPVGAR